MQESQQSEKGYQVLRLSVVEKASKEQRPVQAEDWGEGLEGQSCVDTGEPRKVLVL